MGENYSRCSVLGVSADLVLINGKIVTLDPGESIRESVAVKFGVILAGR
jgi:predicted amidohydrolase YtcJ